MIPDFDTCYRALQARDARFDGLFFVGVGSTGIYCRPVCAARTPGAKSCRFFPAAAQAEQAGFRPCLRCRPELAPSDAAHRFSLEQSLYREIQRHALAGGSLENLTLRTGYSTRQMRRLITGAFGVTPVAIAQTERLLFAKKLLQETPLPVTRVALDAGFRSLRRFNALFQTRYGLSPVALRRKTENAPTGDLLRLRLAFRPPLAWAEMLEYLRRRSIPGVEMVANGTYARTFESKGRPGWLSVRKLADRPCLEVSLPAEFSSSLSAILQNVRNVFDLDANPAIIAEHLRGDPVLAPLIEKNPGLRVPGAWEVFELSVRAVLGQQISVAGATTLAGRLARKFGREIVTPFPELNRLSFRADALAASNPAEIATIGLPVSRARTLHGLALAQVSGKLDFPTATPPDSILSALQTLPGIGPWTASYIAMRGLRLPDAFPAGDLGLRKALGLISLKDIETRAVNWRPWRAYATLHLWHSLP